MEKQNYQICSILLCLFNIFFLISAVVLLSLALFLHIVKLIHKYKLSRFKEENVFLCSNRNGYDPVRNGVECKARFH